MGLHIRLQQLLQNNLYLASYELSFECQLELPTKPLLLYAAGFPDQGYGSEGREINNTDPTM